MNGGRLLEEECAFAWTDALRQHEAQQGPLPISDRREIDSVEKVYGYNSPRYWIFVRGWFPPDGTLGPYFKHVLRLPRKDLQLSTNTMCGPDPALKAEMNAYCNGEYGEADGSMFAFNLLESFVTVEVKEGGADGLFNRPQGYRDVRTGREPKNFIMDSTGGRGVAAILQKNGATTSKSVISEENLQTAT